MTISINKYNLKSLNKLLKLNREKELINDFEDKWTDKDLIWAYKLGLKKGKVEANKTK